MKKIIKIIIIIAVLIGIVIGITVLRDYLKAQTLVAPETSETVSGGAIAPTPTLTSTPTPTCTPLPEKVQIVREDNFFDNLISPLPRPTPAPEILIDDKTYALVSYNIDDRLVTDTYYNVSVETAGTVETYLTYVYYSETFSKNGTKTIPVRSDKETVFNTLKDKYSNAEYWLTMGITDVKILKSDIDYSLEITATHYSQPVTDYSNITVHSLAIADTDNIVASSEESYGEAVMKTFIIAHRIVHTTNNTTFE